jgi:hypothetical protein
VVPVRRRITHERAALEAVDVSRENIPLVGGRVVEELQVVAAHRVDDHVHPHEPVDCVVDDPQNLGRHLAAVAAVGQGDALADDGLFSGNTLVDITVEVDRV